MSSDNHPDDEERQLTADEPTSTRRQAMAGLVAPSLFDDISWLSGVGDGDVNKLLDSGDPVIDLDDITGVNFDAGISVDKDAGEVTIDAQEVEDALLTVLDGGTEVSTTVEELDFATDLEATDNGDGSVTVNSTASSDGGDSGGGGGGLTEVASGTATVPAGSTTDVELTSLDRDGFYLPVVHPPAMGPDGNGAYTFTPYDPGSSDGYTWEYAHGDTDIVSTSTWVLGISNSGDSEADYGWKVYEL